MHGRQPDRERIGNLDIGGPGSDERNDLPLADGQANTWRRRWFVLGDSREWVRLVGEEELPVSDANTIPTPEHHLSHARAVDVRAVPAAAVFGPPRAVAQDELQVKAGHLVIVRQHDVVLPGAPHAKGTACQF